MDAQAVVLKQPKSLEVARVPIAAPGPEDVVVEISHSGVSTGTERLLWTGRMPPFPGMGYPLVPGYESIGEVVEAGAESGLRVGERVFVPGARCFGELEGEPVRGLFGGAASRLTVPGERAHPVDAGFGAEGALLALAATAYHALSGSFGRAPCLIVGHGALGRFLARLAAMTGGEPPTVWEQDPIRRSGAQGYEVVDPELDERRDYATIFDVSGDAAILDALIGRLARGGEIVLAGFYAERLSFAFPPAFMKEARLRAAAEWHPADLRAVADLAASGRLSLSDVVTHVAPARDAATAYRTAFESPDCLKMILDWSDAA